MRSISIQPTFESWRETARSLLSAGIEPAAVLWCDDAAEASLFGTGTPARAAHGRPRKVPPAFLHIARSAAAHSDPRRWGILYRMLWRITCGDERHLLAMPTDPDTRLVQNWCKAVGRDIHKMHAFVRFRLVGVEPQSGREQFIAWFEPEYRIVRLATPFFVKRFANMDWSILTPHECAHWDGNALQFTPGVSRDAAPDEDAQDELWRAYYRSIFNPARLKVRAMQSEMPKKYWKNLPEAPLIEGLIADSRKRVKTMLETEELPVKPAPKNSYLESLRRMNDAQTIRNVICNPSRTAALEQLDGFIPIAGLYARDRNHVKSMHPSVSRLSPAIRHRLISEEEVAMAVLVAHPFNRVEKFIQEVYWRRYWKSWLSLRPEVWRDFCKSLSALPENPRVQSVEKAQSGNAVIDHFANELVGTGYLHNHARMWFAAWWVHEARLPWQHGAAFFYRHLLDGDPASNTLSWRWVAGLQTPGKTYLARRSNLEKYLAPELLESLADGLTAFENPNALLPEPVSKPPITRNDWPLEDLTSSPATGLWIHEEDLSVEHSPLGLQSFSSIIVTGDVATWEHHHFPKAKRQWLADALQDAATRAEMRWQIPASLGIQKPSEEALVNWAKANALDQVVAMRPDIGPLHDSLSLLRASLARIGVRLVLIDRPEDLRIRHFANSGFFQFWERVKKTFVAYSPKNTSSSDPQLPSNFPP